MSICLEKTYHIAAVTGWKDNENNKRAKEQIENKLQSREIVAITPQGKIESTSVEEANKSNNLDIFVFSIKDGKNREVNSYRIHLPKPWIKEGASNQTPLHMRSSIKKQFDLLPGDNIFINKETKKEIVITISLSVTVSCKKETFEFPPLPEGKTEMPRKSYAER